MGNLWMAYRNAKKGKGWYGEIRMIAKRPAYYLAGLKWMMENHALRTSEYTSFLRMDKRKVRKIYRLPFFPDRITQWAMLQVMQPQLLANFTDDTYSAIPGKGVHGALKKLRKAVDLRPEEMRYCLEIDCKKFYPSIDHEILKVKYRRKYKDAELLACVDEIIDSISTCPATPENMAFYSAYKPDLKIVTFEGEEYIDGVGIPIGNYFSQFDGNFYLSDFDHWIKEVKRVKHYYRYMDDLRIFAATKEELHGILKDIKDYLQESLKLRVKGNYQIFPTFTRGVDFVGYRVFRGFTLLRKSTAAGLKEKMRRVARLCGMVFSQWCSFGSYRGWLKFCNGFRLRQKYMQPVQRYAERFYRRFIRGRGKHHEAVFGCQERCAA